MAEKPTWVGTTHLGSLHEVAITDSARAPLVRDHQLQALAAVYNRHDGLGRSALACGTGAGAWVLAVVPKKSMTENQVIATSGSSGVVTPPVENEQYEMIMKTKLMLGIIDKEGTCRCGGKADKRGLHAHLCPLLRDMRNYAHTSMKRQHFAIVAHRQRIEGKGNQVIMEPNVKKMGFPPVPGAKNADGIRGDVAVKDSASPGPVPEATTIFDWVIKAPFAAIDKPDNQSEYGAGGKGDPKGKRLMEAVRDKENWYGFSFSYLQPIAIKAGSTISSGALDRLRLSNDATIAG
jgi:hypothetical protein